MPRILSPEDSQVGDGDRVGLAHGGSSSRTLAVAVLRYIQQSSEFKLFSNLFCTGTVPVKRHRGEPGQYRYLDWYSTTLIIDGFTSLDYNGVTLVRLLTFVPIAGP